ncbi:SGNH/GDSL hydrolase family protein [Fulvivirga kasyanovii]|uniref:GDSL family lipase n=1 Tax=Fulvivirga kasyanovii TaxID=396812 RepID=A0ABW9RKR8_9BACT|nr:SGNH/GDSL hydrolase family protein [Fulvivirga kasyanovii]MTI23973.1 GDSL family lipase [Fulvivirga kasyanovii]
MRYCILLFLMVSLLACNEKEQEKPNSHTNNEVSPFLSNGRVELLADSTIALIGSGSSVEFMAEGDSVSIHLKSGQTSHGYIVLEVDGKYMGRFRVGQDDEIIPLKLESKPSKIGVYKATEAINGTVIFLGADAQKILPIEKSNSPFIEFIGNSITCGMGADTTDLPCGSGEWFDQHNAYLAYGPRVARALNASFKLSSVSGIGMYRNWNDENIDEPIMPQVYENLYLNTDSSKKADFTVHPDVVSICLGTNDLSDGDGVKPRLPFDKEKFIGNYTEFVKTIFSHYPDTKVALLTSPMVSGAKGDTLMACLKKVKENLGTDAVSIFEFAAVSPTGCTWHPIIAEHKQMAEQLEPFFKDLLNDQE